MVTYNDKEHDLRNASQIYCIERGKMEEQRQRLLNAIDLDFYIADNNTTKPLHSTFYLRGFSREYISYLSDGKITLGLLLNKENLAAIDCSVFPMHYLKSTFKNAYENGNYHILSKKDRPRFFIINKRLAEQLKYQIETSAPY